MKVYSLMRDGEKLLPVEVELQFVPGLPQIQILGLPDQAIKESMHRIKTAIRSQGFEFPKAQQVLVNLRPAHLKKNSRGLDLAIAMAFLWKSGQVPQPELDEALVYGELSLSGEAYEPDDLVTDLESCPWDVWTGQGGLAGAPYRRFGIQELKSWSEVQILPAEPKIYEIQRPLFGLDLVFPKRQAELLKVIALGEHSLLLAGPAGSGKSTFAKALHSLLQAPSAENMQTILKNNRELETTLTWRPLVHPHHSVSPLGLIGGGVPPFKGEISRAHKGVLILDELLEFQSKAQETLREPMEELKIRLRRGRFIEEHPAECLVLATTNLCPCGDFVPNTPVYCGRSLRKCQSYLERLSGPLVDRFQVVFFTKKSERGEGILGRDLLNELEVVRQWRQVKATADPRYSKPASQWNWDELVQDVSAFYMSELFPKELASRRRDLATLRVARTLADLEKMTEIKAAHVEKALQSTFAPFESLKRLGG